MGYSKLHDDERLPFGVLQAMILTLEEIRDGAREGIASARLQILHTQRLDDESRLKMMPAARGQLNYWQQVEKALNWAILRCQQRQRWIKKLSKCSRDELIQMGLDESLIETMQWNTTREVTTA